MENLKNQIINKAGFLIYTDYWEKYFSKMTGEQVKEVFKIIFHFNSTFEVLKTDDLAVEMVIATIIDNIKRDATKRAKQAIASAENGKLGGRPKKEAKPKQNRSKTEANVNVNEECKSELINHNDKSELDLFCDEIAISLQEILSRKLNRNITTSNWNKEIKLIINNDLKIRGEQQAKQDLIKCIQAVENHYGKEYFPIIQSAKSLREKFIKIENYLERSPQAKKNKLDEEFLAMSRNNKGEF